MIKGIGFIVLGLMVFGLGIIIGGIGGAFACDSPKSKTEFCMKVMLALAFLPTLLAIYLIWLGVGYL